jgi:hypothetical protein
MIYTNISVIYANISAIYRNIGIFYENIGVIYANVGVNPQCFDCGYANNDVNTAKNYSVYGA